MVSSENFRSLTEGSLDVQSLVYREKSSGEMWASRSAQDFRQTGVTPSGPGAFLLLYKFSYKTPPNLKNERRDER